MASYNSTSATLSDPPLDKRYRVLKSYLDGPVFCGQACSHTRCDVESWNSPSLENGILPLPTSACLCQASAVVSAIRFKRAAQFKPCLGTPAAPRPILTSPGVVVTREG